MTGIECLAAAARAFARARRLGLVEIGESGMFEVIELNDPPDRPSENPDQLRLV